MTRPGNEGYDPFATPGPGNGATGGAAWGPGADQDSGYGAGYQGGYRSGYQGGYGSGYQSGHQGGHVPAPAVPTGRGAAITSLVLGLLSVVTAPVIIGGLLALVSIIFAVVALRAGSRARKLGSTATGPTTAMSVIGIVASIIGLLITAFMLWALVVGGGAAMDCQHLIDNPTSFDACIQDSLGDRLGIN